MDDFVYVVTRDGRRVNNKNYTSKSEALVEAKYWTNLIHKEIHGRKVDPTSVVRVRRVLLSGVNKIK